MVIKASEIKSRRLLLEFTQDYCCTVIGVSRRTWNRWERHHSTPHPIFEAKIRKFLGMDAPALRKYEKPQEEDVTLVSL